MLRDLEKMLQIKKELTEWWERYCAAKSKGHVAKFEMECNEHCFGVCYFVDGESKPETIQDRGHNFFTRVISDLVRSNADSMIPQAYERAIEELNSAIALKKQEVQKLLESI